MIKISRSLARQFRAIARRAGLTRPSPAGSGCVRLVATADAISVHATNGHVAIAHRTVGQFEPADLAVPMQLFADCEAKNDGLVTIRVEEDRIIAVWNDRGVPQQRDYAVIADSPEMPPAPQQMATNGPSLLTALREAKDTAEVSAVRYSLDCLQLKGTAGTVVATDTRQSFVQSGFQFPWQEDLLMRATKVFASSELASGLPVEIGRTEGHVTVRVGEWAIHHEIEKEGRFPKVEAIVPSPDAIRTRLQIDAADAKFLAATINRLPANDHNERPLTIDLNGAVVVRARKDEQSPMTELLLSRSRRIGGELRLLTNRAFLSRALEMGFSEIGFVDNESPCVCQDATRTYLWMVLEPKESLEPSADALTIDSMSVSSNGTTNASASTKPARTEVSSQTSTSVVNTPVNRVAEHLPQRLASATKPTNEVALSSVTTHSTDVIEQALALRNQLRTIVQGLTELVTQIRAQRKHARLMKSTLQSLKQLQLLDA